MDKASVVNMAEFARTRLAKRLATIAHLPSAAPLHPSESAPLYHVLCLFATFPSEGVGDARQGARRDVGAISPGVGGGMDGGEEMEGCIAAVEASQEPRATAEEQEAALAAACQGLALGREMLRRAAAPPARYIRLIDVCITHL